MENNLKFYREKAGLTRPQLAKALGVDRTIVWKYEKQLLQPRDEKKIKIAQLLGATVEEIFFSPTVVLKTTKRDAVNQ